MRTWWSFIFGVSLLFILGIGCEAKLNKQFLLGQWKAARILENGSPKALDLSQVRFEFKADERYYYHDNLNTTEAGRYYVVGEILFTTDTTLQHPKEKSVKIAHLTADSLYFEMNAAGTPQVFELYKVR